MSSSRSTQDHEWDVLGGYGDEPRAAARARRTEQPPPSWLAPLSRHHFREIGYVLTGLPVAIAGFTVAITLFCLGLGTFVTVLGLPVLAGLTTAARGLGRLERARVRGMLALDIPGPKPVRQARQGTWGAITARLADGSGWKAALYQVVMFPWAVFSFGMTLVFLLLGWSMALYPVYHWVFPTYTSWRGYRVFDFTDSHHVRHVYYIEGTWQIAAFSAVGLLLVFLTAQLVHGLTNVNRAAAQGLLGR
ncbi:putative sensor protein [Streptomyces sp. 1114.5]|uniref:sensor domain-containing protein n=1 Tax=unclassified Streptomyces TaxID=2593676 RepID=UPI000BD51904|nr:MULTISPECIES: sensor domain-containing protein [unclassified Streptomyces]RKT16515.1 putative sensor protein [Streptomyces sp. 1114.5]SOB82685.1 Putative sensor [Streptomyces sp. 1331.2]